MNAPTPATCSVCGSPIDFDRINARVAGQYICTACIDNGALDQLHINFEQPAQPARPTFAAESH